MKEGLSLGSYKRVPLVYHYSELEKIGSLPSSYGRGSWSRKRVPLVYHSPALELIDNVSRPDMKILGTS
jgi:hypothetical protein